MEQPMLELFTHPDFSERAKEFYNNYDLVNVTVPGDPKFSKRSLQRSSERTCIFCNRAHPATYQPQFWIHGHIHTPIRYEIGITQIICNPHGYMDEPYNGFEKNLILNI